MGRAILAAFLLALLTTALSSPTTLSNDDTPVGLLDRMAYLLRELQQLIIKAKQSLLPDEQTLSDPGYVGTSPSKGPYETGNKEPEAKAFITVGSNARIVFEDQEGSGDGENLMMSVAELGRGLIDQVPTEDTLYPIIQDNESLAEDTNDVDALMRQEEMLLVKNVPTKTESTGTSPPSIGVTLTEKGTSKSELETETAEGDMISDQMMTTATTPEQEAIERTKILAAVTKTLEDTTVAPFERATEDNGRKTRPNTVEGKKFTAPTASFKEVLDTTEVVKGDENMETDQDPSPSIKSKVITDGAFETFSTLSSQETLTEVIETQRGLPPTQETPPIGSRQKTPEGDRTAVIGADGPTPSTGASRTKQLNPYALGSNGPTYAPRIVPNEKFWTPRCTRPGLYLPHPYNACMFMRCSLFPQPQKQAPALLAQSYLCGRATAVPPWFFSSKAVPCIIRDSKCK